ncbi:hypothetical protein KCG44_10015 [Pacificimonas sp. WHA3]|uniref:Uncharacterized protein n=1 Tax=Pacificimonas pallii TaxID=2827236 RepID=A0ABS6SGV1_9SPHN|nr:hypothetical protein [Pacificimonas pallii]MBV7257116.1 hypothetical protein [Pacificimonas pallii]
MSYLAARATGFLPGLAWHRYRLIAVPRGGLPAMPRGYGVRVAAPEDLAGRIDSGPETISYRIAAGMVPLIAERQGKVLGVNWVTDGAFDEDEVRVRWQPGAGCAWDTGLWVAPEQRLSRAFAALWAGTGAWLAERGLDWSMSRVADYNLASLAPHMRLGAVDLGAVGIAKAGPVQLATRGRPRMTMGRTVIELERPA